MDFSSLDSYDAKYNEIGIFMYFSNVKDCIKKNCSYRNRKLKCKKVFLPPDFYSCFELKSFPPHFNFPICLAHFHFKYQSLIVSGQKVPLEALPKSSKNPNYKIPIQTGLFFEEKQEIFKRLINRHLVNLDLDDLFFGVDSERGFRTSPVPPYLKTVEESELPLNRAKAEVSAMESALDNNTLHTPRSESPIDEIFRFKERFNPRSGEALRSAIASLNNPSDAASAGFHLALSQESSSEEGTIYDINLQYIFC